MQRVADQAQAAKTEASDALAKETSLRSKLDLLCKELQKRNLEMKLQLAKQQEEQLKSHQGGPCTSACVLLFYNARLLLFSILKHTRGGRHAGHSVQHIRRHKEHERRKRIAARGVHPPEGAARRHPEPPSKERGVQ